MNSTPEGELTTSPNLVVRLPYLREMPEGFDCLASGIRGLCRLWPGFPDMPAGDWFCPACLPMEPNLAKKYLADLESLGADDLATAQNQALATENARLANQLCEMDELAGFEKDGIFARTRKNEDLVLAQAHKTLLWIWLAQTRACEIARLAENFGQSAAAFSDVLAEGEEITPPGLDGGISLDESILPSWQTVFLNAALFLPQEAVIFAEGPMRADLLERENFRPSPEFGESICEATLPVHQIAAIAEQRLPKALSRPVRVIVFNLLPNTKRMEDIG